MFNKPVAIPQSQPAPMAGLASAFKFASFALRATIVVLSTLLFFVTAVVTLPMAMGNRTLVILSGSMAPAIAEGAAVVVRPVPTQELEVGDVIAFLPSATAQIPIVHRILSFRDKDGVRFFTTQGDANHTEDRAEVALPPTAWRVWYSVPLAGYAIQFASSPLGTLLLVVIPSLLWLYRKAGGAVRRLRAAP
ncbi:MAG: signal peptidase I [Chloroflexi bacterium]|nr:signal peptidase I [Chloroflexota bacterium]